MNDLNTPSIKRTIKFVSPASESGSPDNKNQVTPNQQVFSKMADLNNASHEGYKTDHNNSDVQCPAWFQQFDQRLDARISALINIQLSDRLKNFEGSIGATES